jgi:hypothetical protein
MAAVVVACIGSATATIAGGHRLRRTAETCRPFSQKSPRQDPASACSGRPPLPHVRRPPWREHPCRSRSRIPLSQGAQDPPARRRRRSRGQSDARARLCRCHHCQYARAFESGSHFQVRQRWASLRQCAGLVQYHDLGVLQELEGFALPKQHAQLRTGSSPDHDRGRRRKSHRTRTGDNQRRHGIEQGKAQGWRWPKSKPDEEGDECGAHHRRHEPHRDLIDDRLDRQLGSLRLLDKADDLGEYGLSADGRGAQGDDPMLVDGPAHHRTALRFPDRHRFAADHGFIDPSCPLKHSPSTGEERSSLTDATEPDIARGLLGP